MSKGDVFQGDDPSFSHTAVVLLKKSRPYYARLPHRSSNYDWNNVQTITFDKLQAIPMSVFPHYDEQLFGKSYDIPPFGCYVKRQSMLLYAEDGGDDIAPLIKLEANVFNALSVHPHDRLCKFLGSLVFEGRVTGFCLKKYVCTLHDVLDTQNQNELQLLPVTKWLQHIHSAVHHLHSLGFCHNDINPANIMIDNDGGAILIDFDSCQVEGALLLKPGTDGWIEDGSFHSSKKNDAFALTRLSKILERAALRTNSSAKNNTE